MRKNDLIKALQDIPGNPEVMLWNGFVQDFASIDPKNGIGIETMTKTSKDLFLRAIENEQIRYENNREWTQKDIDKWSREWARRGYEYNQFVTEEDIKSGMYVKKKIIFIQPKSMGKSTWDRNGSMSY